MENSKEISFRKMTIDDYDGVYDLWLHTRECRGFLLKSSFLPG